MQSKKSMETQFTMMEIMTECQELAKLLDEHSQIPEIIKQNAKQALQTQGNDIEKIRSYSVLIKIYHHFHDDGLLKGVLEYAVHSGNINEVCQFLDYITLQLETWVDYPPLDTQYAKSIIESIIRHHIPQKYKRLEPIKARLNFMQALIYQHGLLMEPNIKQAISSFNTAAMYGSDAAYARLGDMYLKETDSNQPYSEQTNFISALQHYQKAKEFGLYGLSNAMVKCYEQYVKFVIFKDAENCLVHLENLIKQHPNTKLAMSATQINNAKYSIHAWKNILKEAILIEKHYLSCQTLGVNEIEDEFTRIEDSLRYKDNPVYDYYYLVILSFMKNSNDVVEIQDINDKIQSLQHRLLDGQYGAKYQGALNYVYGLAVEHEDPFFTKRLYFTKTTFFDLSISNKFPNSYSTKTNNIYQAPELSSEFWTNNDNDLIEENNPNTSTELDPYEHKPCRSPEISNAMNIYQNAEQCLMDRKQEICTTQWNPGFFRTWYIHVDGEQIPVTQQKYHEMQIINNATQSNNWVAGLGQLNLIQDELVLSLLNGTKLDITKTESKWWFW